ncbi:hypothetical protein GEV33_005506 [Tenebrio molitor]|uniref:Uncharacterized protein n=1 Tax=Tenebrio molitor TaxID=7067 RepID=A0A8J6HEF3_TENMO|nr:hypothetical protein GEV33_005506 [Tenebrio molitor]
MKIVVVCVSNPTLGATFRGYSDSSPTLGATGERSGAKLFRAKKGLRGLLHGVRLFKGFDDGSGPAWVIGMETVEMVKCWLSRQGRYSDGRSAFGSRRRVKDILRRNFSNASILCEFWVRISRFGGPTGFLTFRRLWRIRQRTDCNVEALYQPSPLCQQVQPQPRP